MAQIKVLPQLGGAAQPGAFQCVSRRLNWNIVQKASGWTQPSARAFADNEVRPFPGYGLYAQLTPQASKLMSD